MPAQVAVLGPVEVRLDGQRVPLAPQRLLLLALLAAAAPAPVSVDRLVDQLWDAGAPATATTAIRVHLCHVRRALGSTSSIQYANGGYRLDVEAVALDRLSFEADADLVARSSSTGELTDAADIGSRALARWSGDAFAPFSSHHGLLGVIARLDSLARRTAVDTAVALLQLGRAGDAVALLERWIERWSLDETFAAVVVCSLACAGRSTEALQRAHELRRELREHAGLSPGQLFVDVERRVLDGDDPIALLPVARQPPVGTITADESGGDAPVVTLDHPLLGLPFVGRQHELAEVARATANARPVVITGIAGAGKTALAVNALRSTSGLVLVCACNPAHTRSPLAPLRAAMQDSGLLDHHETGSVLDRWLRHDAALPSVHVDDVVAELASEIGLVLRRQSRRARLTLVVDDLQWSDHWTRAVVGELASTQTDVRLVVTVRSPIDPALDPWIAMLLRSGGVAVECGPLTVDDAEALVGDDHDRARSLHRRTNGHALLLCGMAHADDDATSSDSDHAPATVGHALREWGRRAAAGGDMLFVAAVIGPIFDLATLVAATGTTEEAVLDVLEVAAREGCIVAEPSGIDSYAFVHQLVRDELAHSLPTRQRDTVHAAVAASIHPDDRSRAVERAQHLLATSRVVVDEIAAALGFAVETAIADGDVHSAGALLERLGSMRPVGPLATAQIELAEGRVAAHRGQAAQARAHFARACTVASRAERFELVADAANEYLGPFTQRWIVDDAAVSLLERGLAAATASGNVDAIVRLGSGLARAQAFGDDRAAARGTARRALEVARSDTTIDDTSLLEALRAVVLVTAGPTGGAERRHLAEEAALLARGSLLQPAALADVIAARLADGDGAQAAAAAEALARHADRSGSPFQHWESNVLLGAIAIAAGDFEEAATITRRALDAGRRAHLSEADGTFATQRFVLRWRQGQLDRAIGPLRETAANAPSDVWRAAYVLALAETGDVRGCEPLIDGLVAGLHRAPDYLWLGAVVFAIRAVVLLGRPDLAAQLAVLLEPCDTRVALLGDATAILGPLDGWRAIVRQSSTGRPSSAAWQSAIRIAQTANIMLPPACAAGQPW